MQCVQPCQHAIGDQPGHVKLQAATHKLRLAGIYLRVVLQHSDTYAAGWGVRSVLLLCCVPPLLPAAVFSCLDVRPSPAQAAAPCAILLPRLTGWSPVSCSPLCTREETFIGRCRAAMQCHSWLKAPPGYVFNPQLYCSSSCLAWHCFCQQQIK